VINLASAISANSYLEVKKEVLMENGVDLEFVIDITMESEPTIKYEEPIRIVINPLQP
jgi:hypothetical protein